MVTASYREVVSALSPARATLHPSTEDLILPVVEQARAVVGAINADGPTEVNKYQDAGAI